MELEYVTCSVVVQEVVYLRRFFQHLKILALAEELIIIFSDNMDALTYNKDLKYHGRTKHIDIHSHYIWNIVAQRKVVLKYISTSRMMVDPLPKATARDAFETHVRSLGLFRIWYVFYFWTPFDILFMGYLIYLFLIDINFILVWLMPPIYIFFIITRLGLVNSHEQSPWGLDGEQDKSIFILMLIKWAK